MFFLARTTAHEQEYRGTVYTNMRDIYKHTCKLPHTYLDTHLPNSCHPMYCHPFLTAQQSSVQLYSLTLQSKIMNLVPQDEHLVRLKAVHHQNLLEETRVIRVHFRWEAKSSGIHAHMGGGFESCPGQAHPHVRIVDGMQSNRLGHLE